MRRSHGGGGHHRHPVDDAGRVDHLARELQRTEPRRLVGRGAGKHHLQPVGADRSPVMPVDRDAACDLLDRALLDELDREHRRPKAERRADQERKKRSERGSEPHVFPWRALSGFGRLSRPALLAEQSDEERSGEKQRSDEPRVAVGAEQPKAGPGALGVEPGELPDEVRAEAQRGDERHREAERAGRRR